jgi:hypothetical protein
MERHYGGRTVGKTLNGEEAKQQIKNLFKEIVNTSSRNLGFVDEPVEVCPTKVLLQKIEEL